MYGAPPLLPVAVNATLPLPVGISRDRKVHISPVIPDMVGSCVGLSLLVVTSKLPGFDPLIWYQKVKQDGVLVL